MFERLIQAVIAEAAARGQVGLVLVSVDSTTAHAHHHAAGMVLDGELGAALEEAANRKGAAPKGQNARDDEGMADGDGLRRLRRRHRFRLKAAKLGRSRGGLTSKVHLSADRRCRPLSLVPVYKLIVRSLWEMRIVRVVVP